LLLPFSTFTGEPLDQFVPASQGGFGWDVAHQPLDGLVSPKPGLVHTFNLSLEDTLRIIAASSGP
jgi:hypothetical protein